MLLTIIDHCRGISLMRIWIDMDGVIYDFHTLWLQAHNEDYPEHRLRVEDIISWDASLACRQVDCPADIYSYFTRKDVWTDGSAIGNSQQITQQWINKGHELGIISTLPSTVPYAAVYKTEWLNIHFPHIKDIVFVNGHLKGYINGDILIDDGIHNLTNPNIIGILYTQPWNKKEKRLRADNWNLLDLLINTISNMRSLGYNQKRIKRIMEQPYENSSRGYRG